MPPRTVPLALALPMLLLLLLLVSARAAVEPAEEQQGVVDDPEVTACRQQCARQRQFGAPERQFCLRRCDEYGRAKRREREEGPERERDRCLHECRAGPPKPGCERRCREAYERGDAGPPGRWWWWWQAAVA